MTANQRVSESAGDERIAVLPAWRVILRMIRYRPRLWLVNLAGILMLFLSFQVPGLVQRAFFNLITGDAQVSLGLWSLVALLVATEAARILSLLLISGIGIRVILDGKLSEGSFDIGLRATFGNTKNLVVVYHVLIKFYISTLPYYYNIRTSDAEIKIVYQPQFIYPLFLIYEAGM